MKSDPTQPTLTSDQIVVSNDDIKKTKDALKNLGMSQSTVDLVASQMKTIKSSDNQHIDIVVSKKGTTAHVATRDNPKKVIAKLAQETKPSTSAKTNKANSISLLHRLIISLERLEEQNNAIKCDFQLVEIERFIALRLIEIIPIDELCKTSYINMACYFSRADFIEGYQYLLNNNKRENLVPHFSSNSKNPFLVAIESSAEKVIDFYETYFPEYKQKSFNNILEEIIVSNDLNKIKKIINLPDQLYQYGHSLHYAVFLNRFEIIKLFSENTPFESEVKLNLSSMLVTAASCHKVEIFKYLFDKALKEKNIDSIIKFFEFIIDNNKKTCDNLFISFCIEQIKNNLLLSHNEKNSLMALILEYLIKKENYSTKENFKIQYRQVVGSFSGELEKNEIIKNTIKKAVLSYEDLVFPKKEPLGILLLEKLNYIELPPKQIFNSEEMIKFLIIAIQKNNLPMFYYFFDREQLNYQDEHRNNLAHIAAKANWPISIQKINLANPTLFNQKNDKNEMPQNFLEEKTRMLHGSEQYSLYQKLYNRLNNEFNCYDTLVTDDKWGRMPDSCTYFFSSCDKYITKFNNNLSSKNVAEDACCNLIIFYLKHAIKVIWGNYPQANKNSICDLIYKLHFFNMKKGKVFYEDDEKFLIMALSLYGDYARASEVANYCIEKIKETNSRDLITIHQLTFISLGLQASKLLNEELVIFFYSMLENSGDFTEKRFFNISFLSTVFFKFLSDKNTIHNTSPKLIDQFKEVIEKLDFSFPIINKEIIEDLDYLYCFFESCGVMANWAKHFFVSVDDSYEAAIRISELKILFLTKLNKFLKPLAKSINNIDHDILKNKFDYYRGIIKENTIEENNHLKDLKEKHKIAQDQQKIKELDRIDNSATNVELFSSKIEINTEIMLPTVSENPKTPTIDETQTVTYFNATTEIHEKIQDTTTLISNGQSPASIILETTPDIANIIAKPNLSIQDLPPGTLPRKKKSGEKKEKKNESSDKKPVILVKPPTLFATTTRKSYLDIVKQSSNSQTQTSHSQSSTECKTAWLDKKKESQLPTLENLHSVEPTVASHEIFVITETPQAPLITQTLNFTSPIVTNQDDHSQEKHVFKLRSEETFVRLCKMLIIFYESHFVTHSNKVVEQLRDKIADCNGSENTDMDFHYKNEIQKLLLIFDDEKKQMISKYDQLLVYQTEINDTFYLLRQQSQETKAHYSLHHLFEHNEKYSSFLYRVNEYMLYARYRLNEISHALNELSAKENFFLHHEDELSSIKKEFHKGISLETENKKFEMKWQCSRVGYSIKNYINLASRCIEEIGMSFPSSGVCSITLFSKRFNNDFTFLVKNKAILAETLSSFMNTPLYVTQFHGESSRHIFIITGSINEIKHNVLPKLFSCIEQLEGTASLSAIKNQLEMFLQENMADLLDEELKTYTQRL